jgi:hypothetical protein
MFGANSFLFYKQTPNIFLNFGQQQVTSTILSTLQGTKTGGVYPPCSEPVDDTAGHRELIPNTQSL